MIHAPISGLLHVWGELVLALHGVNGFGGNVAEIYAYQLTAMDPTHDHDLRKWTPDSGTPMPVNLQPVRSMQQLLLLFRDTYDCNVVVDGFPLNDGYMPPTNHRWHVAIETKSRRFRVCPTCRGSGPDGGPQACSTCHGAGRVAAE